MKWTVRFELRQRRRCNWLINGEVYDAEIVASSLAGGNLSNYTKRIVNLQKKETAQCLENTKSNARRTESTTSI